MQFDTLLFKSLLASDCRFPNDCDLHKQQFNIGLYYAKFASTSASKSLQCKNLPVWLYLYIPQSEQLMQILCWTILPGIKLFLNFKMWRQHVIFFKCYVETMKFNWLAMN